MPKIAFPRFQATPSILAQGGGARQPELAAMKKHPEASFAMARVVAIDNLSAFSLLSLAGGITGVTSGLPLGFQGGLPRCLLGEFRIAGLLLGF
jgi:hypothetical protein